MKINIVLFQPEIPQNTGNIARTCSATGSSLHLVHPLGYSLDEKHLRRAGLDYWDGLDIHEYENDDAFFVHYKAHQNTCHANEPIYFLSQKGGKSLWATDFTTNCNSNAKASIGIWLVFGRESRGLDESLLLENKDKCIRIPMIEGRRSLNLSNAVAVTVYEVLRQFGGVGLKVHGKLEEST